MMHTIPGKFTSSTTQKNSMAAQAKRAAMHTGTVSRMALRRLLLIQSKRQNWQVDVRASTVKQTLYRREMLVRQSVSFFITYKGNNMLNKALFKEVLIASTLLIASGYTVIAQAHCLDDLTIAAVDDTTQYDAYVTKCPVNSTGLTAKVGKQANGGNLTLTIGSLDIGQSSVNDNAVSAQVCNAVTGTIPANASPQAVLVNSAGNPERVYTLVVSKNSALSSTYDLEWHCSGAGLDLPESPNDPAEEIENSINW